MASVAEQLEDQYQVQMMGISMNFAEYKLACKILEIQTAVISDRIVHYVL
jgi:hypothetical protein